MTFGTPCIIISTRKTRTVRDNIEVEGQIKRRIKKFSKPVSDWTANFWGDVTEFLNVGSFRWNIFSKVSSSKSMTLKELIGCNF